VREGVKWFIIAINLTTMFGMVAGILMHSGRGGGLSDMFGGASGASLGSTAAERNLTRITLVLSMVWVLSTVTLGLLLD
jgi:preprotein translocase subunit SecG